MSVSSETGSDDQVEQPHGYSNCISASVRTRNSHQSGDLVRRGLTPEARSAGSVDVDQMLGDTYGSSRLSRSVRIGLPALLSVSLGSMLSALHEEHTQAALDLIPKALGLLMKSMENTQ